MYEAIFFDLDGTLVDSGTGITNAVSYTLKQFGIEVQDRSELNRFVGPPLVDAFQEFYGFSEQQAEEATVVYRKYYRHKGVLENRVYDGVEELLKRLCKAGKEIYLATSKPEEFAKKILVNEGLEKYFTNLAGSTFDGTRRSKASVIAYAMEQNHLHDPSKIVMVGDREHDILGARTYGIDSIGVLFGYGSRKELEEAGATYIAVDAGEVGDIILGEIL